MKKTVCAILTLAMVGFLGMAKADVKTDLSQPLSDTSITQEASAFPATEDAPQIFAIFPPIDEFF